LTAPPKVLLREGRREEQKKKKDERKCTHTCQQEALRVHNLEEI